MENIDMEAAKLSGSATAFTGHEKSANFDRPAALSRVAG